MLTGDPNDGRAIKDFKTAVGKLRKALGKNATGTRSGLRRLWAYGREGGPGVIAYESIRGGIRPEAQEEVNLAGGNI